MVPDTLLQLCSTFRDNIERYKSFDYDEANTRVDFIDKFFELLGWDVRNLSGYSEDYRDVVREDRVTIEGKPKAPDYSFRVGGSRKFFVEAKKPSISLKDEPVPAFQVRRYGYTAKLPLAILTDFEEFAVYDTRIKPDKNDKASVARIFYCTFEEYPQHWDFITQTFAKEAILKGSFDRYVTAGKTKKGTSGIDRDFLALISGWREELARNLALRNKDLDLYALNTAVQKIIDRIIFLRIAEDRGTEVYKRLHDAAVRKGVYVDLQGIFLAGHEKYNSDLFRIESWLNQLIVDDHVLKSIIVGMYYPDCPYEFSVLPVEVLGNIYEQFLGQTIRLTAGHQAKIEEKPEVRKAGGVFYTPQYIVDYIVRHTVGPLLEGRTPEQVGTLRIVDPACGSGSFLLGAYHFLLDWHLAWYTEDKQKAKAQKTGDIYLVREGHYNLSIAAKQRILQSNIYGVDIDPQAVEVSKLSLLLKLMEDEGLESRGELFKYSDFRYLPNLGDNVKCGNSLVGSDFYATKNMDLFGVEEMRTVNVFDWPKAFPKVFAQGGFDAVIGNPPYVRQEILGAEFKDYAKSFATYAGTADLYCYFMEKGHAILKVGGHFGVIVANKWMRANYGQALRRFMAKKTTLKEIIDFGELPVFQGAATFPAIILSRNLPAYLGKQNFGYSPIKTLNFLNLDEEVASIRKELDEKALGETNWTLSGAEVIAVLEKMKKMGKPLGEFVEGKIYWGIKTGLNEAFVIDSKTRERLIAEDIRSAELIKPFAVGDDIRKYEIRTKTRYLIFTRRGTDLKKYPAIENHLQMYKKQLMPKPDDFKGSDWPGRKAGVYKWYEIQDSVDYHQELENSKIVWPEIAKESRFCFDETGLYLNNKAFFIPKGDLFLLGYLNSKLAWFYLKSICSVLGDADKGGRLELRSVHVSTLPIPPQPPNDPITPLVRSQLEAHAKRSQAGEHDRPLWDQKITTLDRQIDGEVYKLYGLMPEEIAIVEG